MRRFIANALFGFSIALNVALIAAYKSKCDECDKLIEEGIELEKKLENPFIFKDDSNNKPFDINNVLLCNKKGQTDKIKNNKDC